MLLLTHIHLDHAGATGVLCRRFPELVVYVHERGAPHLIDPSKLLKSAARLYGDDMERLWGEVAPVDEERVRTLSGGEVVEGFRVAYTPGHASHHVSYLHEATGDAYVGDVAGVRVPPHGFTVPPTPPPDIDLELWEESLQTLEGWDPTALCLTHFGRHADVAEQIAERARGPARAGRARARQRRGRGSWPRSGERLAEHMDPGRPGELRAGGAARPALPGPRALLAQARGGGARRERRLHRRAPARRRARRAASAGAGG